MKITFLGQAGLLFETCDTKIMIDPYFSDSVQKIDAAKFRRVPVCEAFLQIKPDIMIFTHNHIDHFDPETVAHFLSKNTTVTVLAPASVWSEVRKIGGKNNFVLFNRHTQWTHGDIRFTAVKAEHSDPTPIGVIIEYRDKKYYITGDTLYNSEIFCDIPKDIYAAFLPINGVGNNMNMDDARRFCEAINPQFAVPVHWGMFDEINVKEFSFKNTIIPEIYKEVQV